MLEEQNSSSKVTTQATYVYKYCQTKSEGIIFCYECEFPADDFHDLGEHMLEFHFLGDCEECDETFNTKEKLQDHLVDEHGQGGNNLDINSENFSCNHCEQGFTSKKDLMMHKKHQHLEMISTCWGFAAGSCEFGSEKCWFRHSMSNSADIKCKICDEKFGTKPEYQKHRKKKHPGLVPRCNYDVEGKCKFGIEFCWFIHKEDENNEVNPNNDDQIKENNEVLTRLLDLVENMSERMKQIECVGREREIYSEKTRKDIISPLTPEREHPSPC